MLASDEAYSELWFDEPPPSALQLDDWTNVVAFNTLSKRSSMTGFRSGFVAGDHGLIDALRSFRPNVGTAPQEFVQRASVVAWGDEEHVERAREALRAQARAPARRPRPQGPSRRRRRGDDVPLDRACPDGETSEEHARACSSTASSSRPARTSARPERDTSATRSSRRRRTALARRRSWRMSSDGPPRADRGAVGERRARRRADRGGDRAARPWRAPGRGAGRRRLGRQRVGEEGDPPLLPAPQGRADGRRRPPLPRQDPGQARRPVARRSGRAARVSRDTARSSPRASS